MTQHISNTVSDQQAFHFSNNGSIHSIEEMISVLEKASSFDFAHHVNHHKNDIAAWIAGVFENHLLAEHVGHTTDRRRIIQLLEKSTASNKDHKNNIEADDNSLIKAKVSDVGIDDLHKHIKHLEHHVGHIAKKHTSHLKEGVSVLLDHEHRHGSLKKGLVEFSFGLLIGLVCGLLLAKTMGLY